VWGRSRRPSAKLGTAFPSARQLFSVVLFKTLKRALEGRKFAWDKLEPNAAVKYVPSENRDQVNVP